MLLTSLQNMKLSSTAAGIEIAAKDGILLTSGGGYIRIKGGNIDIHAPGTIDLKGAKKTFSGGTSLSHSFNEMPKTDFADPYVIKKLSTGEPAPGVKVEVTRADGSVMQYVSDAAGKIPVQQSQIAELLNIKVLDKT